MKHKAVEKKEGEEVEGLGEYCEQVPLEDAAALGGEDLQFIGVFFSAEYCPPCKRFVEPIQEFKQEMCADGRFQLILVNCDKRELEFSQHLAAMPEVLAMPFNTDDALLARLEEGSNANVIPKLSVYAVEKGFDKPVVNDLK